MVDIALEVQSVCRITTSKCNDEIFVKAADIGRYGHILILDISQSFCTINRRIEYIVFHIKLYMNLHSVVVEQFLCANS